MIDGLVLNPGNDNNSLSHSKAWTYGNKSRKMGWGDGARRVHVENSGAAAARRPRLDANAGVEVKVVAEVSGEFDGGSDRLGVSGEGEDVAALAIGTLGDLGKSNHVGIKNGESMYWLAWKGGGGLDRG